jgi:hypothetical protein
MTALAMGNNDWTEDDVEKFRHQLPEYYRHYTTAFFPYKDSEGRPQIFPMDPMLPWSTWNNAGREAIDRVMKDGVSGVAPAMLGAAHNLGFLGGPVPSAIAAYMSERNTYTGQPITTPGANGNQQMWERMVYGWDLMSPAFLRSTGWFHHMKDTFMTDNKNQYGDLKYTPGQTLGDLTGLGTKPVNERTGNINYQKEFTAHQRDINRFKVSTIRDKSLSSDEKAAKISDANERLKMLRQQYFPQ